MRPWAIVLTVAGTLGAAAGYADQPKDLDKLPLLVRIADADTSAPVIYTVPRADVAELLKAKAIEPVQPRGVWDEVRFRFTSPEAAQQWFAKAQPLPARQKPGGKEALTALGWANFTYGPFNAPDGRAWFWRSWTSTLNVAEFKKRVEATFQNDQTVIDGVRILHLDRAGRMWALRYGDSEFLYGYDPKAKTWTQRRAGPYPESFLDGPVFENKSGLLFFPDRSGVHIYDGKAWSRQPLFERNVKEKRYNGDRKTFAAPSFREDADGRVYVWAYWGHDTTGTIGYWVYDGEQWKNIDAVERLWRVVPRTNGEAWLIQDQGKASLWAGGRLIAGKGLQEVLCPHLNFGSARFVTADREGTAYFQLKDVTDAKTGEKLADRGLAVPAKGKERELEGKADGFLEGAAWAGALQGPDGWLWRASGWQVEAMSPDGKQHRELRWTRALSHVRVRGFDNKGNLYLEGSQLLWRVSADAALDRDGPDGPALPAMQVHIADWAWPDSRGRMWCTWFAPGSPTAIFDGKAWKTLPERREGEIRGFLSVFPGSDGAMVLVDSNFHFHLHDEKGTISAESPEKLALEHPERLARALTYPPLPAGNFYYHLVKDAKGRIWWAHWSNAWGVVDGKEGISGKASSSKFGGGKQGVFFALEPLGDGKKILALDEGARVAILDVADGEIVEAGEVRLWLRDRPTNGWWRNLQRDSSGRIWIMSSSESYALDERGQIVEKRKGLLKLEDSKKNLWFYEYGWEPRSLVRRAPDGKEVRLQVLNLSEHSAMAEAPDGSVWALTTSHLIRVRADGDRLVIVEQYLVPVASSSDHLWCDKEGRVWHMHYGSAVPRGWHLTRYATTAK